MKRFRWLSPERWAALVFREIVHSRREVREFMSRQTEQFAILTQQQQEITNLLAGLGGDFQQLLSKQHDLVQQLAELNTQVGQDLSPMITSGQGIINAMTGMKQAVEEALGIAQTPVSTDPGPGTPPVDPGTPPVDTPPVDVPPVAAGDPTA